jgi:hypothetical protein
MRFRTTELPTFRLIAYATATVAVSESSATKLIRSEPLCPRPVGEANKANCRRVRTRSGTLRLDRQLMTALVATGFQDGTASAGSHARTETVRFSPFPLVWLIGTLHKILFSNCLDALRGTPWGSLARYWEQSYLTGPSAPARRLK